MTNKHGDKQSLGAADIRVAPAAINGGRRVRSRRRKKNVFDFGSAASRRDRQQNESEEVLEIYEKDAQFAAPQWRHLYRRRRHHTRIDPSFSDTSFSSFYTSEQATTVDDPNATQNPSNTTDETINKHLDYSSNSDFITPKPVTPAEQTSKTTGKTTKQSKNLKTPKISQRKFCFICCDFEGTSEQQYPGMSAEEERRLRREFQQTRHKQIDDVLKFTNKEKDVYQIEVIPVTDQFQEDVGKMKYAELEGTGIVFVPSLSEIQPDSFESNATSPWWLQDSCTDSRTCEDTMDNIDHYTVPQDEPSRFCCGDPFGQPIPPKRLDHGHPQHIKLRTDENQVDDTARGWCGIWTSSGNDGKARNQDESRQPIQGTDRNQDQPIRRELKRRLSTARNNPESLYACYEDSDVSNGPREHEAPLLPSLSPSASYDWRRLKFDKFDFRRFDENMDGQDQGEYSSKYDHSNFEYIVHDGVPMHRSDIIDCISPNNYDRISMLNSVMDRHDQVSSQSRTSSYAIDDSVQGQDQADSCGDQSSTEDETLRRSPIHLIGVPPYVERPKGVFVNQNDAEPPRKLVTTQNYDYLLVPNLREHMNVVSDRNALFLQKEKLISTQQVLSPRIQIENISDRNALDASAKYRFHEPAGEKSHISQDRVDYTENSSTCAVASILLRPIDAKSIVSQARDCQVDESDTALETIHNVISPNNGETKTKVSPIQSMKDSCILGERAELYEATTEKSETAAATTKANTTRPTKFEVVDLSDIDAKEQLKKILTNESFKKDLQVKTSATKSPNSTKSQLGEVVQETTNSPTVSLQEKHEAKDVLKGETEKHDTIPSTPVHSAGTCKSPIFITDADSPRSIKEHLPSPGSRRSARLAISPKSHSTKRDSMKSSKEQGVAETFFSRISNLKSPTKSVQSLHNKSSSTKHDSMKSSKEQGVIETLFSPINNLKSPTISVQSRHNSVTSPVVIDCDPLPEKIRVENDKQMMRKEGENKAVELRHPDSTSRDHSIHRRDLIGMDNLNDAEKLLSKGNLKSLLTVVGQGSGTSTGSHIHGSFDHELLTRTLENGECAGVVLFRPTINIYNATPSISEASVASGIMKSLREINVVPRSKPKTATKYLAPINESKSSASVQTIDPIVHHNTKESVCISVISPDNVNSNLDEISGLEDPSVQYESVNQQDLPRTVLVKKKSNNHVRRNPFWDTNDTEEDSELRKLTVSERFLREELEEIQRRSAERRLQVELFTLKTPNRPRNIQNSNEATKCEEAEDVIDLAYVDSMDVLQSYDNEWNEVQVIDLSTLDGDTDLSYDYNRLSSPTQKNLQSEPDPAPQNSVSPHNDDSANEDSQPTETAGEPSVISSLTSPPSRNQRLHKREASEEQPSKECLPKAPVSNRYEQNNVVPNVHESTNDLLRIRATSTPPAASPICVQNHGASGLQRIPSHASVTSDYPRSVASSHENSCVIEVISEEDNDIDSVAEKQSELPTTNKKKELPLEDAQHAITSQTNQMQCRNSRPSNSKLEGCLSPGSCIHSRNNRDDLSSRRHHGFTVRFATDGDGDKTTTSTITMSKVESARNTTAFGNLPLELISTPQSLLSDAPGHRIDRSEEKPFSTHKRTNVFFPNDEFDAIRPRVSSHRAEAHNHMEWQATGEDEYDQYTTEVKRNYTLPTSATVLGQHTLNIGLPSSYKEPPKKQWRLPSSASPLSQRHVSRHVEHYRNRMEEDEFLTRKNRRQNDQRKSENEKVTSRNRSWYMGQGGTANDERRQGTSSFQSNSHLAEDVTSADSLRPLDGREKQSVSHSNYSKDHSRKENRTTVASVDPKDRYQTADNSSYSSEYLPESFESSHGSSLNESFSTASDKASWRSEQSKHKRHGGIDDRILTNRFLMSPYSNKVYTEDNFAKTKKSSPVYRNRNRDQKLTASLSSQKSPLDTRHYSIDSTRLESPGSRLEIICIPDSPSSNGGHDHSFDKNKVSRISPGHDTHPTSVRVTSYSDDEDRNFDDEMYPYTNQSRIDGNSEHEETKVNYFLDKGLNANYLAAAHEEDSKIDEYYRRKSLASKARKELLLRHKRPKNISTDDDGYRTPNTENSKEFFKTLSKVSSNGEWKSTKQSSFRIRRGHHNFSLDSQPQTKTNTTEKGTKMQNLDKNIDQPQRLTVETKTETLEQPATMKVTLNEMNEARKEANIVADQSTALSGETNTEAHPTPSSLESPKNVPRVFRRLHKLRKLKTITNAANTTLNDSEIPSAKDPPHSKRSLSLARSRAVRALRGRSHSPTGRSQSIAESMNTERNTMIDDNKDAKKSPTYRERVARSLVKQNANDRY